MKPTTMLAVTFGFFVFLVIAIFLFTIQAPASEVSSFLLYTQGPSCSLKPTFKQTSTLGIFKVSSIESQQKWYGTAFLIEYNKKRYLLSARHVCDNERRLELMGLKNKKARTKILRNSVTDDACVLSADDVPKSFVPLQLFPVTSTISTKLWEIYGYAKGETLSKSCNSFVDLVPREDTFVLLMEGLVIPGMSGGPIIETKTGQVVGIVVAVNFKENYSLGVSPYGILDVLKGVE